MLAAYWGVLDSVCTERNLWRRVLLAPPRPTIGPGDRAEQAINGAGTRKTVANGMEPTLKRDAKRANTAQRAPSRIARMGAKMGVKTSGVGQRRVPEPDPTKARRAMTPGRHAHAARLMDWQICWANDGGPMMLAQ